jgi:hypothetical protein
VLLKEQSRQNKFAQGNKRQNMIKQLDFARDQHAKTIQRLEKAEKEHLRLMESVESVENEKREFAKSRKFKEA